MKTKTVEFDSKFHSDAPFTNVDIRFRSEFELQSLIDALTLLRDGEVDCVEIEDSDDDPVIGLGAAIYFNRPGLDRDETDINCMAAAEDLIMRYQQSES